MGVETSREWQPTPQVEHQLRYLNSYLMKSTDGRIIPVRSQCKSDVFHRRRNGTTVKKLAKLLIPC